MILDSLKNAEAYYSLHPLFKEAFEYLRSRDFYVAENGKIELRDKDLFLMISDSGMKSQAEAKLEAHCKYIDIQMPVSKAEQFGWKAKSSLVEGDTYNEERDIQFFADKASSFIDVRPGDFVIFFPEDGHAPCIGEDTVKKVVVKVKL